LLSSSLILLFGTLAVTGVGLVGIAWARCSHGPVQACWGRRLFFAVLAVLGAGALIAAWQPQSGFLYAGLAIAGLLIIMLWEGPQIREQGSEIRDQDLLVSAAEKP